MALPGKVLRMSIRTEAEEHLRIIRSLMEKATVYRAISAPAALVGGVGALGVAATGIWGGGGESPVRFLAMWLGLLAGVSMVNLWLLARDAARRGEAFVSAGMRLALRAMLPGLLAGGLLTLPFAGSPLIVACVWVLCYALSLLAASHFSPKSICWLGRAFFVAAVCLFALAPVPGVAARFATLGVGAAHAVMGATFGLFHLAYAAFTWPRRAPQG